MNDLLLNNEKQKLNIGKRELKHYTSLSAVIFEDSSELSRMSRRTLGRTFQNCNTKSGPFLLPFCNTSFARYRKGIRFFLSEQWNSLSHTLTI